MPDPSAVHLQRCRPIDQAVSEAGVSECLRRRVATAVAFAVAKVVTTCHQGLSHEADVEYVAEMSERPCTERAKKLREEIQREVNAE